MAHIHKLQNQPTVQVAETIQILCDAAKGVVMEQTEAGWPVLVIDRNKRGSLVDQIVAAITAMVNSRELRVGTKMPSVRRFAKCNAVSTFTVVESYDRLLTL